MKSTLKTIEEPKIEYPILMQNVTFGHIVLFYALNRGILVYGGNLGYSTPWCPATDEKIWKRFDGKIELSND